MSSDKPNGISFINFTNILVTIGLAVNAITWTSINRMDGRISKHLENAELHVPRATIVSRDEFFIYQSMRDRQMADIKDGICKIENILQKHVEKR